MDNINIVEKYALCMLKEKKDLYGDKVLAYRYEGVHNYILAAMIMQMMLDGNIEFSNKNEITLNGKKPSKQYLLILYNLINNMNIKQINIKSVMNRISYADTKSIIDALIEEMIKNNQVEVSKEEKIIGNKTIYKINEEKFDCVIQEIRAEFLEKGIITDELVLLAVLLNSTKFLKNIFTKYEKDKLKERLDEIDKTDISDKVKIAKSINMRNKSIGIVGDFIEVILTGILSGI